MNQFQTKLRRADRYLYFVFSGFIVLVTALFFYSFDYLGIKAFTLKWLLWPVLLFIAWTLLRGEYFKNPAYVLSFAFVVWYLASRMILGDTGFRSSRNFMVELLTVFGFAFLYACVSGDWEKRRTFNILLTALVLFFAYYAVVGVVASLTRNIILLPGGVYPTYFDEGSARVFIVSQGPNEAAAWACLGIVFTVYLLLEYDKRWLWIPGGILLILFFWIMALTNTQGAKLGLALAAVPTSGLLFWRFVPVKKKILLVPVMIAGMLLTWYAVSITGHIITGVDSLLHRESAVASESESVEAGSESEVEYEVTDSEEENAIYADRESLLYNTRLSGRTDIYKTVISWLSTHPKNLKIGNLESRVVTILGADSKFYGYLHSSWLQVLCVTGIPGLLIALALCVVLLVYGVKILCSDRLSLSEKMVPVLVVPMAVHSSIESFLFVTNIPLNFSSVNNLLFFFIAGYVVQLGRKERKAKK